MGSTAIPMGGWPSQSIVQSELVWDGRVSGEDKSEGDESSNCLVDLVGDSSLISTVRKHGYSYIDR